MRTLIAATLAALTLLIALPAAADETPPPDPGLTGTWVRNADLSDDPTKILGDRKPPQGGRGGPGGGMGRGGSLGRGGGMGRGGVMGRGGGDDAGDRPVGRAPNLMQGLERLVIFHEAEEFSVTDANDVLHTAYTDGRETGRWTRRGQEIVTAAPSSEGLVVRAESAEGEARTATYRLDDTGRLRVVHAFKPPRAEKTITMTVIYDRAD